MDGLQWKALLKWMIWGYPYFRKHPYVEIIKGPNLPLSIFLGSQALLHFQKWLHTGKKTTNGWIPKMMGLAKGGLLLNYGHCLTSMLDSFGGCSEIISKKKKGCHIGWDHLPYSHHISDITATYRY